MLRLARQEPSAILLAAQLASVLRLPLRGGQPRGAGAVQRPRHRDPRSRRAGGAQLAGWTWLGASSASPATVLLLIQAVTGDDALLPYSSAIEAVLYFYAAGALIAYMLADHVITRDELFAVGATFTLVAWAFAYAYTVCQAIEPGSFTAAIDPDAQRTWMELLFMSFSTLSSTGLGDVVPVKPFARALVMIEQLAGLAYVAMVVSRLVGLMVMNPRERA